MGRQRRQVSFLQIAKVVMVLGGYLPFLWSAQRNSLPIWHWTSVLAGVYLALSLGLRNLTPLSRTPVWIRALWVGADLLIWAVTRGLATDNCPTALPGIALAADATSIGWPYMKGFWHWLAASALVLASSALHSGSGLVHAAAGGEGAAVQDLVLQGAILAAFYTMAHQVRRRTEDRRNLARAHAETERAYKAAELANTEVRTFAGQVEQVAVLRERARLAREVHDTVSHAFTGILMQLEAAKTLVRSDPDRALATLDLLLEQTSKSLSEVRRSVHALRPLEIEQQRGVSALQDLAERFASTTGVVTRFHVSGSPEELPAAHELSLFRAMQEGLTNAFRHGQATKVDIELAFSAGQVALHLVNDCQEAATPLEYGLGLLGINERAAVLGGTVAAGPNPAGDFSLRVTLPLISQEGQ